MAIGVAVGVAVAMGLTRFMTSQLFGISPLDLPTHATVALGLLVTAGLASFVSAHRAAALDPVDVLQGLTPLLPAARCVAKSASISPTRQLRK